MKPIRNILFIRLDKIGDLVCTLPCDQHPEMLAGKSSYWVISKGNEFIIENATPSREYLALDPKSQWKSFFILYHFIKEKKIELAISFQSPWWVNLVLLVAQVAFRYGVKSQWHSYLFLNHGLRQKRSLAQKHETDYNDELVRFALDKITFNKITISTANGTTNRSTIPKTFTNSLAPFLQLRANLKKKLPENFLSKFDLTPKKYIVIHPGMAGSALNWSPMNYISFINKLESMSPSEDISYENASSGNISSIVITGTIHDEKYLSEIKSYFLEKKRTTRLPVLILQNKLSVEELLIVLENAYLVLAPSTGVLHLAASLSVRCLGLYSPIPVQSPTRWGARGKNVRIFSPSVNCPAKFKCIENLCPHFPCMDQIKPEDVFQEVISENKK